MTLFPELFTHSHTFKLWQWTKLSPVLLRVTGELTFGLQKQTSTWQISVWASSRLPPLWPLGAPLYPSPPLLLSLNLLPASSLSLNSLHPNSKQPKEVEKQTDSQSNEQRLGGFCFFRNFLDLDKKKLHILSKTYKRMSPSIIFQFRKMVNKCHPCQEEKGRLGHKR